MGPQCINGKAIINCHYANNNILFLQAQKEVVEAAWWTIVAFEALSRIKMNYEKIEMYHLNLQPNNTLDQIFKCKWRAFPIQYLGLPLADQKLKTSD